MATNEVRPVSKTPGTTSPYMNRHQLLREAIETRGTPQEVLEFYPDFLAVYEREHHILQTRARAEMAAWGDISFALYSLPIPPDRLSTWLMTLPPEVASVYEETKVAEQFASLKPHKKSPLDRVMDDVRLVKRVARKVRFRAGLMLLGAKL